MTEVAHASSASCLGVISIAGARLGRWGETKEGHTRVLTAVPPTPGEMSASTRFQSRTQADEWQVFIRQEEDKAGQPFLGSDK